MKSKIKKTIILVSIGAIFGIASFIFAQSCPLDTKVLSPYSAILVGEVTSCGTDCNMEVWFEWGKTTNLGNETPHQKKYGTGLFCYELTSLTPYTTYYYRAVAKNSVGTSYGQIKSFTTFPLPPTVITKGVVLTY